MIIKSLTILTLSVPGYMFNDKYRGVQSARISLTPARCLKECSIGLNDSAIKYGVIRGHGGHFFENFEVLEF